MVCEIKKKKIILSFSVSRVANLPGLAWDLHSVICSPARTWPAYFFIETVGNP